MLSAIGWSWYAAESFEFKGGRREGQTVKSTQEIVSGKIASLQAGVFTTTARSPRKLVRSAARVRNPMGSKQPGLPCQYHRRCRPRPYRPRESQFCPGSASRGK